LRLHFYQKRKEYLLSKLDRECEILDNKKRFILAVVNEEIKIRNVKKQKVVEQLVAGGFKQMRHMTKVLSTKKSKSRCRRKRKRKRRRRRITCWKSSFT